MVCHHRVSSPCECRRMMRSKSLEVTRSSLTTCYASLCDSSRCNTYSLSKSLLIKYGRLVKCRWCLTSASWTSSTSSTSSSSTSHLHNEHGRFNFNVVSLRLKHSPEALFIHRKKKFHIPRRCIYNNFNINISYFKSYTRNFFFFTKTLSPVFKQ